MEIDKIYVCTTKIQVSKPCLIKKTDAFRQRKDYNTLQIFQLFGRNGNFGVKEMVLRFLGCFEIKVLGFQGWSYFCHKNIKKMSKS
jgi:hypothetical protein